jgi:hypothetical protein
MPRTIGEAVVKVTPDTKGVGAQASKGIGSSLASGLKAVGKAAGLALGAGIAAATVGIGKAIASARDLNETQSAVQQVFGKSSAAVRGFSREAAGAFGQTQQQALNAAKTFGVYGKAANLSGKENAAFSIGLTKLASDMASFSNTSVDDAIAAIGAAMRGESDPIEKYGVLLNDATLKARAFKLGLIKTRTEALTPANKVLAAQAEIMAQTKTAQGDFARTSAGLANQQRIAAAQVGNLSARIGQSLLPVATQLVTTFNTKLIPALNDLWTKHGPQVTKWLEDAAAKVGPFVDKLATLDFAGFAAGVREAFAPLAQAARDIDFGKLGRDLKELGPALKDASESGGAGLVDTLKVGATVMKFAAQHVDLLAKALPYLVAALVAFKVAQLAANVAAAFGPAIRIAEIAATRKQTAALTAHTAALSANRTATVASTVATAAEATATNAGILAKVRNTAVTIAQRAATIAGTVATWLATAATTALGVAMNFALGPIGLIIIGVALLVAGIILLWKKNETFRKIVIATWEAIKTAVSFVVDWFMGTAWPLISRYYELIWSGIKLVWSLYVKYLGLVKTVVVAVFSFVVSYVRTYIGLVVAAVKGVARVYNFFFDAFERARNAVVSKAGAIVSFVRGIPGKITGALGNLGRMLFDAGRNIIQGLIDGIASKVGALKDKVSGVVGGIRNMLPFSPAKEGPLSGSGSPDIAGAKIVQMIADGMLGEARRLAGATARTLSPVEAAPQGAAGTSARLGSLEELMRELIKAVYGVAPGVGQAIGGVGVAALRRARTAL